MPALVNRTVVSFAGSRDAAGISVCPRSVKKSMKRRRMSSEESMAPGGSEGGAGGDAARAGDGGAGAVAAVRGTRGRGRGEGGGPPAGGDVRGYSARAAATTAQELTTLERRRAPTLGVVDDIAVECTTPDPVKSTRRGGSHRRSRNEHFGTRRVTAARLRLSH